MAERHQDVALRQLRQRPPSATFGHAVNVVCQSCRSILDAANPSITILQQYTEAVREEPLFPGNQRQAPRYRL